jgi:hypothetical protein
MSTHSKALQPEDLTRLFVERTNAGDAAGIAELYEEKAVMAYRPAPIRLGGWRSGGCGSAFCRRPPDSSRRMCCPPSSVVTSL